MLYVSKILYDDGRLPVAHTALRMFNVAATELETGKTCVVAPWDALWKNNLGVAFNIIANSYTACVHTSRTAMLHNYVRARTSALDLSVTPDYDWFDLSGKTNWSVGGNMAAVVSVSDMCVEVYGAKGNIAVWSYSPDRLHKVYTLYALMLELCQRLGVNLFKYQSVRVITMSYHKEVFIGISHSTEAELFYTKAIVCGA